jgi:hypothetical protein
VIRLDEGDKLASIARIPSEIAGEGPTATPPDDESVDD